MKYDIVSQQQSLNGGSCHTNDTNATFSICVLPQHGLLSDKSTNKRLHYLSIQIVTNHTFCIMFHNDTYYGFTRRELSSSCT